jgi:hypothetical protein
MTETDAERLERARKKFSQTDADILRTTAHGWMGVEDLTLINPGGVACQILAALDALAIVYDDEVKAAEIDRVMRELEALRDR